MFDFLSYNNCPLGIKHFIDKQSSSMTMIEKIVFIPFTVNMMSVKTRVKEEGWKQYDKMA